MKEKRSRGVTVFATLIIIGSLLQILASRFDDYNILHQPLPENLIFAYFLTVTSFLILGLIAAIGLFSLKNIFRKTILLTSAFCIFTYLFSGIFFMFRNLPIFIEKEAMKALAKCPTISESILLSTLWVSVILGSIIDFGFSICVIYFFTRPSVKEQFK